MIHLRLEPRQPSAIGNGVKLRSLTYSKLDRLPKRIGNHQNVREKDRCVETKPAHGLKRHFSRKFRIKTKLEKISRLFPYCPVFRQVPAGFFARMMIGDGLRASAGGKNLKPNLSFSIR